MRITNGMMSANYLKGLNSNLTRLEKYQNQLTSNKRITRLSDDPVAIIGSLSVRTRLKNLEQYQTNIDDAQAWLTQSETAVMDLNEVVKSAYELAIQAGSGTQSPTDKAAIATAIGQLREHALQVGNTTLGDKYIFGGFCTTTAPFGSADGSVLYQGTDLLTADSTQIAAFQAQTIEYQIGDGLTATVSLTGDKLLGTGKDNLIGILDNLRQTLLNDGAVSQITAYAAQLQHKQDDILALAADIGGRTNRLDLVTARYGQDTTNYEALKSAIEDVDTAETIMRMKMAETVYNAALELGSRIIVPTLTDFLN